MLDMRVTHREEERPTHTSDFRGRRDAHRHRRGRSRRAAKEQQYDIASRARASGDRGKTVLRVLAAWGDDATVWVGRASCCTATPRSMFGSEKVGGIRVSRLSHIDAPVTATTSAPRRGEEKHKVDPLPSRPAPTSSAPSGPPPTRNAASRSGPRSLTLSGGAA